MCKLKFLKVILCLHKSHQHTATWCYFFVFAICKGFTGLLVIFMLFVDHAFIKRVIDHGKMYYFNVNLTFLSVAFV